MTVHVWREKRLWKWKWKEINQSVINPSQTNDKNVPISDGTPSSRGITKPALCIWSSRGLTREHSAFSWCVYILGACLNLPPMPGPFGPNCHHVSPLCHNSRPLQFIGLFTIKTHGDFWTFLCLAPQAARSGVRMTAGPPDPTVPSLLSGIPSCCPWASNKKDSGHPLPRIPNKNWDTETLSSLGFPPNNWHFILSLLVQDHLGRSWAYSEPGQHFNSGLISGDCLQVPHGKSGINTFIFHVW